MDTTLTAAHAATEAGVTVATIRTWCRRGVITATKVSGRWVIDPSSLNRRIRIGQESRTMTPTTTYRIEQGTAIRYGTEREVWSVVRTDGTPAGFGPGQDPRIHNATFTTPEIAEIYRRFYEETPAGYRLERDHHSSRSMRRGSYWRLTGSGQDDPDTIRHIWEDGEEVRGSWPEGTTWLDVLIFLANRHAEGAPARIEKAAAEKAIAEAEAAVREAREAQLAEARRTKGALATDRQISYILSLLARRRDSGEGGGFFSGPTTRADLELLSKAEASAYIDSLTDNY
ncbi:hypothetical protein GCM10027160_23190 [Streptomyces calidiresistens]|uniref:Helix-turn-helix domain-containing protein n=1 Tax=Streptomyces calidiresistens TaxID=1485586 RepID=A0A7W3T7A5_9ACTN|nr:helix-turn-helix domain-containing protein [Streptomyces calidiresistens]MBB0232249.1 helix-turn-helix domain-containing protein [Streptomyces calidiresistens]